MKNKPKVLFIADKWSAGNEKWGLSEWEGNLWQSLKVTGLACVDVFHFDDYYITHGVRGDEAVLKKIAEFSPHLIFLVSYAYPGSFNTISLKTLKIIKERFSLSIAAIWGDAHSDEAMKIAGLYQPFVDFNVFTASSVSFRRWRDPKKFSYFWVPKNPEFFYDSGRRRDIDISYPGTPKPDRLRKIRYLEKLGMKVYYAGGERQQHLALAQFAEIFQRSKIILSFSYAGYTYLTCARVFEAADCGAMLLEEANPETAKLFLPGIDYVSYSSKRDLFDKARYYLEHDDERMRIAERACEKARKFYSAHRFWKIILKKAEEAGQPVARDRVFLKEIKPYQLDQADDETILENWGHRTIELPWNRLKKLAFFEAFVLKSTDWLCSRRATYFCYIVYRHLKDWRSLLFNISYPCFKIARSILPKGFGESIKKRLTPCLNFLKIDHFYR